MDYREALTYIYSFTNFEVTPAGDYSSKTFDLTRMERLLAALGNPQTAFRSVHIAGTKGKGSTAAMLATVLEHAGHRTGLYISPHLHTFRERIRVDGRMISEKEVAAGVERIKPIADHLHNTTTFEIVTALAFDYFRARGAEWAVLEVGLGGRLDATNVVLPQVSIITSISYDHTTILGNTTAQIASEKAGIIKPHTPAVTAVQDGPALATIQRIAQEHEAPLTVVGPDLTFAHDGIKYQLVPETATVDSQRFAWVATASDSSLARLELTLPLWGHHQLFNAAAALAAIVLLRAQQVAISDRAIQAGLIQVTWPGRFEVLQAHPALVVDGAHNGDSAKQLAMTLADRFPQARWILVIGASNDKDIRSIFAELLPHAHALILTRARNPRASDPVRLAELAALYKVDTFVEPDLAAALQTARTQARPMDVVCVTGSLFVVAEARQVWLEAHGQTVEKD